MNRVLDRLFNKIPPLVKRNIIPFAQAYYKAKEDKRMSQNRWCNICGWRGKDFDVSYSEVMKRNEEGVCPNCKSEPRQRALFRYLQDRFMMEYLYIIKERNFLCLEIGADPCNPVEKALKGVVYVSVDLEESKAMFQMDLTDLRFKNDTFNLVVCSHVLEHVEDDIKAIDEIHRVLRKGGVAIIQVPIGYYGDPQGKKTVEFGKRLFCDHVRSYGWDIKQRLVKAGFKVRTLVFEAFENKGLQKLGIKSEVIFECKR